MQAIQRNSGSGTAASASEFLTFKLGNEEYGINTAAVREICGYDALSTMGDAPEFIKGRSVIKLGDIMVPVVIIRRKLSLVFSEYKRFTTVIILNLSGRNIGVEVDDVTGVMSINPEQISPLSSAVTDFDARYILGHGTVNGRTLLLVDAAKLRADDSMGLSTDTIMPEIVQFLARL